MCILSLEYFLQKGWFLLNELQLKAIEELKTKNTNYIKELDFLVKKINKEYSVFDEFEIDFFKLMNEMERSSSQIPFLPFNNAYCMNDNEFLIPTTPCIIDPLYGRMGPNFYIMSEEYMKSIDNEISQGTTKMKKVFSNIIETIQELLNNIIASNSITKRLSGLEDKITELQSNTIMFWYPRKLSQHEYSFKGSIQVPMCVTSRNIVYPFHRQLLMNLEYIFKTKNLHTPLLKKIKATLNYINEYLPFAELVPLKESSLVSITNTNTVSPQQTQIGSDNEMDGEINIGNGGKE